MGTEWGKEKEILPLGKVDASQIMHLFRDKTRVTLNDLCRGPFTCREFLRSTISRSWSKVTYFALVPFLQTAKAASSSLACRSGASGEESRQAERAAHRRDRHASSSSRPRRLNKGKKKCEEQSVQ